MAFYWFLIGFWLSVFAKADGSQINPATTHDIGQVKTERVVLFLGDSLTQGYGVERSEAYPELLGAILKNENVKIINGGISGALSSGADQRLNWYLKRQKPSILVLALGANDALAGKPVANIRENLEKTIVLAKAQKMQILLVGFKIYQNWGADYQSAFEKMYKDLAKKHQLEFLPFLLEGVALNKELNLKDERHPNAKGQEVLAQNVLPHLRRLLKTLP